MSYSPQVVREVIADYEKKHERNESERQRRLEEVYSACPEVKTIDFALSKVGLEIMSAIRMGKEHYEEELNKVRDKNLELQEKRKELLIKNGFAPDYTNYTYDCDKCKDTGYCGTNICSCYKSALVMKSYEYSGLASLLKTQSFETFSFDYYSGKDLELMKDNYDDLYNFAMNFKNDKRSFLLFGPTGLGKTHLSTSVAKRLLDKGYNVVYETSQNLFSNLMKEQFRDGYENESFEEKYLNCDLLIIDDLGTELVTKFTISCLYNIINTRLNKNLPIIANTNLDANEIRNTYNDRITSRLFGEFIIKRFSGKDIRKQKL